MGIYKDYGILWDTMGDLRDLDGFIGIIGIPWGLQGIYRDL